MLLKDGNVLEMMQGQYNSYGCCFKEMGGVARQPCPVPNDASFDWKALPWNNILQLMHLDTANGIAAYHVGCWQKQLDEADKAVLPTIRQRLAFASVFIGRLTQESPVRALPGELLVSIGQAAAKPAAPRVEPQPVASESDPEQGWGEYKHTSSCAAMHVVPYVGGRVPTAAAIDAAYTTGLGVPSKVNSTQCTSVALYFMACP